MATGVRTAARKSAAVTVGAGLNFAFDSFARGLAQKVLALITPNLPDMAARSRIGQSLERELLALVEVEFTNDLLRDLSLNNTSEMLMWVGVQGVSAPGMVIYATPRGHRYRNELRQVIGGGCRWLHSCPDRRRKRADPSWRRFLRVA